MPKPVRKDLVGLRFGRLVVTSFAGWKEYKEGDSTRQRPVWTCLCDCGTERVILGASLGKQTFSCGCLLKETAAAKGRAMALPVGEASLNQLLNTYQRAAKDRGFNFLLSKNEALRLFSQDCEYCGKSPSQFAGSLNYKNGRALYNGIDRIDNSVGYTIENCVSCCNMCNRAKKNHSVEDFKEWIERAYTHMFGA